KIIATVVFLLFASGSEAAVQTKEEQKCINTFNKDVAGWSKAFNANATKCIKDGTKGKVLDAQSCVEGDPQGKEAKAETKLTTHDAQNCTANLPEFGRSDPATAVMGADDQGRALVAGIFGPVAQPVLSSGDKPGAVCQNTVVKAAGKLFDAKWAAALKLKKSSLKEAPQATSSAELQADVEAGVAADPKVGKAIAQLASKTDAKCAALANLATLFPGDCPTGTAAELSGCIEELTECRFCRALNAADAFAIDCGVFDNGTMDLSCSEGAGAIFVSQTTGNDANPGTRDQPVATIQHGINLAAAAPLPRVLVAAGTCVEGTVSMAAGVTVTGGFDPTTWAANAGTTTLDSSTNVAVGAGGLASPAGR